MKAAIIVFSPTGNTLKVSKIIGKSFNNRKVDVQLVNLTRNKKLFAERCFREFLLDKVEYHDVLLIGSPVYAHHLHYNVKDIIKSLPKPEKKWGTLTIPFITYGGINSGIALYEAAKLLTKSGRIVIAGMKVNAFHSLTKLPRIKTKINEGKPDEEIASLVEELMNKILDARNISKNHILKKLRYQGSFAHIKANLIFREKLWQNLIYPKIVFNASKCNGCGKCTIVCPVGRISLNKKKPEFALKKPKCIHCSSCVFACPKQAIDFKADWDKWNKLIAQAAKGKGPLVSHENPKSAIY